MSGDSVGISLSASAFATGSSEATKLFEELRKPLLRYLVCLGLSPDEAQDVAQDAFLSLHRHVTAEEKSDGGQENIRSWLFRVAHNQARNRQASYARRFTTPLDASRDDMPDHATPERELLAKEKFQQLRTAIRSLTETERECLMLRAEGLRYREIADVLGISLGSVANSLEKSLSRLAQAGAV